MSGRLVPTLEVLWHQWKIALFNYSFFLPLSTFTLFICVPYCWTSFSLRPQRKSHFKGILGQLHHPLDSKSINLTWKYLSCHTQKKVDFFDLFRLWWWFWKLGAISKSATSFLIFRSPRSLSATKRGFTLSKTYYTFFTETYTIDTN